jgi:hypothetical protein
MKNIVLLITLLMGSCLQAQDTNASKQFAIEMIKSLDATILEEISREDFNLIKCELDPVVDFLKVKQAAREIDQKYTDVYVAAPWEYDADANAFTMHMSVDNLPVVIMYKLDQHQLLLIYLASLNNLPEEIRQYIDQLSKPSGK